MTIEEKAAAYDAIMAENEKLRRRLRELKPTKKFVEVSLTVRGKVAVSDIYLAPPEDFSKEHVDNLVEDWGGVFGFAAEFEDCLEVLGSASLVEED